MLRCLAVDDEPVALEVIRTFAQRIPFVQLEQTFTDPTQALAYLRLNPVDLVFLDINMPVVTGLDFAQALGSQSLVVFTTAYSEHALRSYELNVLDYLLKPIAFDRFVQSCRKAQERLQTRTLGTLPVFVKDGYEWIGLQPQAINYLEAADNYVKVHQSSRPILVRTTLSELLALLPAGQFIRVHRSFAVNTQLIQRVGRAHLHLPERTIPIGPAYRDQLARWLIEHGETR
ncbi:LytR/AlgR family response regulator transcription factor [Larkinella arboricola]|nr:LytTR family DNA-binding domain-containing protein [Larkinella arboricola]